MIYNIKIICESHRAGWLWTCWNISKKTAEKICQLLNYLFKDKHVVGIHKYYLDDCQISKSLHH